MSDKKYSKVKITFQAFGKNGLCEERENTSVPDFITYIFRFICSTAYIEKVVADGIEISEFRRKQTDKELFKDKERGEKK